MFSEEIVLQFAKNYTTKINSIELLGVSHNTVYKINCDKPFILRITSVHHRSKDDLLSELNFLLFLNKNGVHVATPVSSLINEIVIENKIEDEIYFIAAFKIAKGLQWQERADSYYFEHIGRELGRIHKASKNYHVSTGIPRRQYYEGQHVIKAFDIFEKYDPALNKAYKKFMSDLSILPKSKTNYGLIHGDFLLSNYNISSDNTVTVYDFDECEYSWFINDIATLIYYHLTGGDPSQTASRTDEAIETILKIMSGYLKENDLPTDELKNLDMFLKLRDYVLLSSIIGRGDDTLGWWDEKLVPTALNRVLNNIPFVDIDIDLVIEQIRD